MEETIMAQARCNFCDKEMNDEPDSLQLDCGGDCLECMADHVGDPDSVAHVAQLRKEHSDRT